MKPIAKQRNPLAALPLALMLLILASLSSPASAQGIKPGIAEIRVNRHSAKSSDLSDQALSSILFYTNCGSTTTSLQIVLGADGKLTGECGSDAPASGTYESYKGTLNGTVDAQGKVAFTLDLVYTYRSKSTIGSQGKEVGWFTETGKTQVTYKGTGKFTSDIAAEGTATWSYTCSVAYSEQTGNVPYGAGGQCPGSKAKQGDKVTDTGTGSGTVPWTLSVSHSASAPVTTAPPAASSATVKMTARLETPDRTTTVPLPYPEPVRVVGYVRAQRDAGNIPITADDPALPAKAVVYFDGEPVFNGQPGANGQFEFTFVPPATIPAGRSEHQFKLVATRDGAASGEATLSLRVHRGLSPITVSARSSGTVPESSQARVMGSVRTGYYFGDAVQANIVATDLYGNELCRVTTDAAGGFDCGFAVSGNVLVTAATRFSKIAVKAVPAQPDLFEDGSAETSLKVVSAGDLAVRVQTDKSVYGPDETIVFSGQVTAAGKPLPAAVVIEVDGTRFTSVGADSNGRFSYSFTMAALPRPKHQLAVFDGYHYAAAFAQAQGYSEGSGDSAHFMVSSSEADCAPLQFQVGQVAGSPVAQFPSDRMLLSNNAITPGNNLAAGARITVNRGDRVELRFALGGNAAVKIVVGPGSNVRIARYCLDSQGITHLRFQTNNPSNSLINTTNLSQANVDIRIETPSLLVKSKSTRYYVLVDGKGATTVAAQEGIVEVGDWEGAGVAELHPAQQVTVKPEETVAASKIVPATLKPDPGLELMLTDKPSYLAIAAVVACFGLAALVLGLAAALILWRLRRPRPAPALAQATAPPSASPSNSKPTDLPR